MKQFLAIHTKTNRTLHLLTPNRFQNLFGVKHPNQKFFLKYLN